MSRGWGKVAGKVLDKNRPFFVYPWGQSLMVDFQIMVWMIGLPLAMGFLLAFIPFNREVLASSIDHHDLYTYFGMTLLGASTGDPGSCCNEHCKSPVFANQCMLRCNTADCIKG